MLKFDSSGQDYKNAVRAVQLKLGLVPSPNPKLDSRLEFYFQLLAEAGLLRRGTTIADLGGGLSWFSPVLSQMGLEVSLIDDFAGGGGVEPDCNSESWAVVERFRELGVKVYSQDLLNQPLPFPNETLDVFTCFHSLEHWHHSPRRLFAEIRRALRPQGYLVLATLNAVNLRKRAYAVLGLNPAPDLRSWYDQDVYRGHVREPSIRDLHWLMSANGFRVLSTYGRNFFGQDSVALSFLPHNVRRILAKGSESVLRYFPSLCSDIHVVGQRQER